jgi:2-dehydropantoate 2-reductase
MRVLIYGGGAVGLGIASCLLQSGCGVDILGRSTTTAALQRDGLVRTGLFGPSQAAGGTFGAYASLDELPPRPYDFVLVCTKSFDSAPAAQDLASHEDRIGGTVRLVLFQNGWGNAEIFCARFAPSRIYNARVITGFRRHRPNEVEITVHADSIHIGSLYSTDLSSAEQLCRLIHQGGIPCETTDAIGKDLWAKMLYNCALNALGAVLNVPYGALAEQATTRELMNRIIEEVFAVMTAAGYRTHWPSAREFIELFYERLVPDTASHRSSTLQDIGAGRRTEIDALNGAVLALADKHSVAVPYNRAVYDLVRFVESARQ